MRSRITDTDSSIERTGDVRAAGTGISAVSVALSLLIFGALAIGLPEAAALGARERVSEASARYSIAESDEPCPCTEAAGERGTDTDRDAESESGARPAPEAGSEPRGEPVPMEFRIVSRGTNAAQKEPLVARADTQAELRELWDRVARTRVPEPDPPEVDFEQQTLIAVFLGERSTGGYSVEIDTVCRTPEAGSESSAAASEAVLHLCYTEYQPAEDAMVTMALTSPYVVVAVEGRPERVVVHRRSRTR
ncbi:MAG: protease complex subunit PrcB family protein [Spirochaetaceae bacterium]